MIRPGLRERDDRVESVGADSAERRSRRCANPHALFVGQVLERRRDAPECSEWKPFFERWHVYEADARRTQPDRELGVVVIAGRSRTEADDGRLPPERDQVLEQPA